MGLSQSLFNGQEVFCENSVLSLRLTMVICMTSSGVISSLTPHRHSPEPLLSLVRSMASRFHWSGSVWPQWWDDTASSDPRSSQGGPLPPSPRGTWEREENCKSVVLFLCQKCTVLYFFLCWSNLTETERSLEKVRETPSGKDAEHREGEFYFLHHGIT